VHRFEASADYDPAPGLEKIQASVLAINFADDELNPPDLGIVDRAKQRVRNGQFVLIPASSQTQDHMTLRKASIYAPFVADFLAKLPMAPQASLPPDSLSVAGQKRLSLVSFPASAIPKTNYSTSKSVLEAVTVLSKSTVPECKPILQGRGVLAPTN